MMKLIVILIIISNILFSNEKTPKLKSEFKKVIFFNEKKENIKEEKIIKTYTLKNIDSENALKSLNGILGLEIKVLDNEMIFIGKKEDIEKVIKILDKLDKTKEMILIKAHIIDTSLNLFDRLGFNWKLNNSKEKLAVDFLNNKINLSSILNLGGNFLGADIDALRENGEINIKQIPSINVLDGKFGEIKIADEIIFTKKSKKKDNEVHNFEAGLIFKVIPKIVYKNGEKYIRLHIFSEISNFKNNSFKHKNIIESDIILKNNTSIFLGGLFEEKFNNKTHKTPILGDIPIFGIFFTSKNKVKEKREMYIEIEASINEQ